MSNVAMAFVALLTLLTSTAAALSFATIALPPFKKDKYGRTMPLNVENTVPHFGLKINELGHNSSQKNNPYSRAPVGFVPTGVHL